MKLNCSENRPGLLTRFINWLLKGTDLMVNIDEVTAKLTEAQTALTQNNANLAELGNTITALASKVDEIQVFIETLKNSVPQEKIDALDALAASIKSLAESATSSISSTKTSTDAALADLDSSDE